MFRLRPIRIFLGSRLCRSVILGWGSYRPASSQEEKPRVRVWLRSISDSRSIRLPLTVEILFTCSPGNRFSISWAVAMDLLDWSAEAMGLLLILVEVCIEGRKGARMG